MSTATFDLKLMVELDSNPHGEAARAQAYAEKLRQDERFKDKVFINLTLEAVRLLLDKLEDRDKLESRLQDGLKLQRVITLAWPVHVRRKVAVIGRLTFEKLLNNPFQSQELWENIAAWILKRLEAWNQKDQQPEDIPLIWARAKGAKTGEVSREDYLIELCAFYVAGEWLQQLNLSALSPEALGKVLGFEGNIIEAIDKLSQLQKEILRTLLERSGDNPLKPLAVPWQPSTLPLSSSSMDRTTISKSLLKLAERNLVQRLDYEEEFIPTTEKATMRRTKAVRLTELGVLVTKAHQNATDFLKIK